VEKYQNRYSSAAKQLKNCDAKLKGLFREDGSQLHLDKSLLLSKCKNSFFIDFAYLIGGKKMSKKILVCDDTAFMRSMLKDILVKNGYEVVGEAENGKVAIEKHNQLKPDLTLMDITMPEMDGISAVSTIVKNDANANIIMCSALGQEEIVVNAIKAGAKDFIVKPFQNERLIEAIRRAIGE